VTEQKTLNVGDPAPSFTLKTIGMKDVSLGDYKGKNVVLLFYPLDWTPG
jgi:peroxiredoxin Q/BCP